MFEILAKANDFVIKWQIFTLIQNIVKDTIDDYHVDFTLHKKFVSKDKFDLFDKSNTIRILFDIAKSLSVKIEKDLETNINRLIVIQ